MIRWLLQDNGDGVPRDVSSGHRNPLPAAGSSMCERIGAERQRGGDIGVAHHAAGYTTRPSSPLQARSALENPGQNLRRTRKSERPFTRKGAAKPRRVHFLRRSAGSATLVVTVRPPPQASHAVSF